MTGGTVPLAAIFIRTILIYLLLIAIMRLSGKRQIGEIQLSELVTTFLLSEIASHPLTNANIPFLYAVIPILTIISLEIIMSFLSTKSAVMKSILDGKPSIIIRKGVINQKIDDLIVLLSNIHGYKPYHGIIVINRKRPCILIKDPGFGQRIGNGIYKVFLFHTCL